MKRKTETDSVSFFHFLFNLGISVLVIDNLLIQRHKWNSMPLIVQFKVVIIRFNHFFLSFSPTFRYLAVCHPFFVHQDQTFGSSGTMMSFKKRTWRYLLPALFFAAVINIPKFMEFKNSVKWVKVIFVHEIYLDLDRIYMELKRRLFFSSM